MRRLLSHYLPNFVVLSVLALPAVASATTVTLAPTADLRVVQATPTSNFSSTYLRTVGSSTAAVQSALKFTVSGALFPLTSAKLRLYVTDASTNGPAVYATTTTWSETTTNWNTRPVATSAASEDKAAVAAGAYVDFDVKPLVTTNAVVAFLLTQPNNATDATDFNSREMANPPQLVLTWDAQCAGKANGTSCTDSSVCTVTDTCQSGVCTAGAALNCNDANTCTTDGCNAVSGCTHTNNTLSCNADNNACTADLCAAGVCKAGAALVCNDNNACTTDACNTGTGACVYTAIANCQLDTIIAKKSSWKYLDTGTNQGTAWRAVAFSDSGWKTGNAALGYGVTGLTTTVGYGSNANSKYITTYFRRTFPLSDPSVYKSIALTVMRDDGVVVYLNGTEVFRDNMPTGTIAYNTLATLDVTDATYHEAYVDPALLLVGNNTIAVEVHQKAANSADLSFDLDLTRRCALPLGDSRIEALETKCDGVDNDCDGVTDQLMPIAANACSTGLLGACASGFSACMPEGKACLGPPAVAETKDGIDNNCNGIVDDGYAGVASHGRVRVLLGPGMGADAIPVRDGALEMLNALGVPADALDLNKATLQSDWADGFATLANYSVVYMPGYLIGTTFSATQLTQLETWVMNGGILIWVKPGSADVLGFAGLSATAQHIDATRIKLYADNPATLYLDSMEERSILISNNPVAIPIEVFTYTVAGGSNAVGFGTAMAGAAAIAPTLVRTPYGTGTVYTMGYDALGYTDNRCYLNCFDPGRDIMTQIMRGALRQATGGHYALKHAIPGTQGSAIVLTHDLCAEDAQNDNALWGTRGALLMAQMEQSRSVKSTYLDTTDYVNAYFNPALITDLCNLGMCPEAGHSVQHVDMSKLLSGSCAVTKSTYNTASPTICGETSVNFQLMLAQLPGVPAIRAWRSPYLAVPQGLYEVLASEGVNYDSSFGMGDVRTHYPVNVARFPNMQWIFHGQPLHSFPIVMEDGIGGIDAQGVKTRIELQRRNQPWFLTNWQYTVLQNNKNHAWSVQLVHPSYGIGDGVGYDNLPIKIESVRKFVDAVKSSDIMFEQLVASGDFWRARDQVKLTSNYDPIAGYSGTITTGSLSMTRFSMEFGDNLISFTASGGGTPAISGNRVVLPGTLAANTTYSFTAKAF